MNHRQALGQAGESFAADQLTQQGYEIVARNWHCEAGEADIIALHNNEVVVIEVRARSGPAALENAIESITPRKQAKLIQIAYAAHQQWGHDGLGIRVDIATVERTPQGMTLELYPNALSD